MKETLSCPLLPIAEGQPVPSGKPPSLITLWGSRVPPTPLANSSIASKLQKTWQMLGKPLVLTSASLADQIDDLSKVLKQENFQIATIEKLRECEPDFNLHLSIYDNFFKLGGNSLLAGQVIFRLPHILHHRQKPGLLRICKAETLNLSFINPVSLTLLRMV